MKVSTIVTAEIEQQIAVVYTTRIYLGRLQSTAEEILLPLRHFWCFWPKDDFCSIFDFGWVAFLHCVFKR